jgi:hypothetical protein
MTMAKRRTRDLRGDPTPLVIDLDPDEIERNKAQWVYWLNVAQILTLRILDFCLLSICLFFHNLLALKSFSWPYFFKIASIMISYSFISWLMLYLSFEKIRKFDISFIFLVLGIFI